MRKSEVRYLPFLLLAMLVAPTMLAQRPEVSVRPDSTAASSPRAIQPEEFGLTSESIYNINPSDFISGDFDPSACRNGAASSPAGGGDYSLGSYNTIGVPCHYTAPIHLPSGVLLKSATIYYQDLNPDADPTGGVFLATDVTGSQQHLLTFQFPVGCPGCGTLTQNFPDGTVVDNGTNHYAFTITLQSGGQPFFFLPMSLYRVAIRYQRQVSPAPATATFSDVPTTHPFFRFVEALYASGITAGCGTSPPQFCPDAPVTRGQMAVFLSAALGLHWAP